MKKITIAASLLLFFSPNIFAAKQEIWHGWAAMPLIPCSKEFTYKDDFGLTWPSVRTAPQEWHTYIYLDAPKWDDIQSKVKECASISAGVAGGMAFYTTPASAWPAFKASFKACTVTKGLAITVDLLSITSGSECKW